MFLAEGTRTSPLLGARSLFLIPSLRAERAPSQEGRVLCTQAEGQPWSRLGGWGVKSSAPRPSWKDALGSRGLEMLMWGDRTPRQPFGTVPPHQCHWEDYVAEWRAEKVGGGGLSWGKVVVEEVHLFMEVRKNSSGERGGKRYVKALEGKYRLSLYLPTEPAQILFGRILCVITENVVA